MIEAVIIDDESNWRMILRMLLEKYPNIKILGEADSVASGVELIDRTSPNLVFLDVQMHDEDGFALLKKVKNKNFNVIFTTAFDEYAINAFKVEALDYLRKPVDAVELEQAIKRAESTRNQVSKFEASLDALSKALRRTTHSNSNKVALSTKDGIQFIAPEEILRCESEAANTIVHLKDGRSLHTNKSLKEYEAVLDEATFFKVHKSHIINLNYVVRLNKDGFLQMEDESMVPLTEKSKSGFLKKLLSR
jgi:two-component system, LytTR family, response regulator